MMAQQNAMASHGYNNSRQGFSNSQMLSQPLQRKFNVKVDKTIGPVILRYNIDYFVLLNILKLIFSKYLPMINF